MQSRVLQNAEQRAAEWRALQWRVQSSGEQSGGFPEEGMWAKAIQPVGQELARELPMENPGIREEESGGLFLGFSQGKVPMI